MLNLTNVLAALRVLNRVCFSSSFFLNCCWTDDSSILFCCCISYQELTVIWTCWSDGKQDLHIGQRMMTISTVGVPNTIAHLATHKLQSTLAIRFFLNFFSPACVPSSCQIARRTFSSFWLRNNFYKLLIWKKIFRIVSLFPELET
jgi:hypothetical protein